MAIKIESKGPDVSQMRFKASIEAILNDIRKKRSGRIILELLEKAKWDVVIEPFGNVKNNALEKEANTHRSGNSKVGTAAQGTKSRVSFSPKGATGRVVGHRKDEILLHELCHSYRTVYGLTRLTRRGDLAPMGSHFHIIEDFFAIMVTNVYSSECRRPLRGDHRLGTQMKSVDQLRKRPFNTRLRDFTRSMPHLCTQLKSIPPTVAEFNPFRDL